MDYTQFLNLTDPWRVFLVDLFPADEVESRVWSQNYTEGAEVLTNGDLEAWDDAHIPTGWTIVENGGSTTNRDGVSPHSGSYCIRQDIDSAGNSAPNKQTFSLTPGSRYRLTLWYKGTAPSGYNSIWFHNSGHNVYLNSSGSWGSVNGGVGIALPNTSVWTKFTIDFDAHASYSNYLIQLQNESGCESSSLYWDDVSLVPLVLGNCYSCAYTDGVVCRVVVDGEEWTEAYSIAETDANEKYFYYDFDAQKLYLHMVGAVSPGLQTSPPDYDYTILAISGRYISNAAFTDDPVVVPRITEALDDGGFELWSDAVTLSKWTKGETGTSTVNRETTDPKEGAFCVRMDIDGSNSSAYIYQSPRLVPGAKCKLVIWYKHTGSATSAIELRDAGSNVWLKSDGTWDGSTQYLPLPNATVWTKYELEFTAHASYIDYFIAPVRDSAASESCYFDKGSISIYREDNPYQPMISSQGMPALHQMVALFHEGSMAMEFGTIQFVNDGWWWKQVQTYLWYLQNIRIRFGSKGASWEEFADVFTGMMRAPQVNNLVASIDVVDNKIYTYVTVPPHLYDVVTYPNLEDGAEGQPIPIIYGEFSEIVPTLVSTATWKFKVADHALEDIPEVWKNGILLTVNVDYTLDLPNGEFTLLADPGQAFVTCSVKGKKCSILDGTYSENVADILCDLLISYCGVDPINIDYASFMELRGARSQCHQLYLNQSSSALDVVRLLVTSALFYFIPLQNGKLGAFRCAVGVDSTTPVFVDEDWTNFATQIDTETVFQGVRVNYNYLPSQSHFDSVDKTEVRIVYRYGLLIPLFELNTSLRRAGDADNLADYYIGVLQAPAKKVTGSLPSKVFSYRPGQKIIVNKTRTLADGTVYSIFNNSAYRILDLQKQMQTGKVDVIAWDDLQAGGGSYCEVCYNCEVCVDNQGSAGKCTTCYSCQNCVSGQCPTCQSCYYCQSCNTGQCPTCEACDTCQNCDSCQISVGGVCVSCEKCNTGQCSTCQQCVSCQICNTSQMGCKER